MATTHSSSVHGSLERDPGNNDNWIERLPRSLQNRWHNSWAYRAAKHIHNDSGFSIGHAIATAINSAEKGCSSGDLNWSGKQSVNPKSRSEMCASVATWKAMKAANAAQGVAKSLGYVHKRRSGDVPDDVLCKLLEHDRTIQQDFAGAEVAKSGNLPPSGSTVTISKVDEEQQIAFGWASVGLEKDGTVFEDSQGDMIDDPEEIAKSAYDFVLHSRDGGEEHVRKGVSTLVESFVTTPEKQEAMGIPSGTLPVGWWVGFKVSDPEVWKGVKEGRYTGFSVHGSGKRTPVDGEDG